jgi:chromosomal replication initiator protein
MHSTSAPALTRFVPSAASADALAAAIAFVEEQAGTPELLLLHGPTGVGKTHLLRSILHRARARHGWNSVIHTTGTELIHEMVQAVRGGGQAARNCRYSVAALVVVDDLHVLARKPATQGEVAHLLKTVIDGGTRVAAAVGCALTDLPVLTERMRAMREAKLVRMESPGRDDTRRILKGLATAAGLTLDARTIAATADRCQGDVRRVVAALARHRFESTLRAAPPRRPSQRGPGMRFS